MTSGHITLRFLLTQLQEFAKTHPEHEALDAPVIVRLQTNEEEGDTLHVGGLLDITIDAGCTETFALVLDAAQD